MAKRNVGYNEMEPDDRQTKIPFTEFQSKRFSLEKAVKHKLTVLETKIDRIEYADITWLCRIEEFLTKYGYLTERQFQTLDNICSRY